MIVLVATTLVLAGPLHGQSLFGSRGLGVPVAAVDARARALGGIGIGLLGLNPSMANPASAAGIARKGIAAGVLSSPRTMELEGVSAQVGTTRFPLARVLYPLGGGVVATAGYGAFLDQSWAVRSERTDIVGSDTVAVTDITESVGGIGQAQVGLAVAVAPSLALGAAVGFYTGRQTVIMSRQFTDSIAEFQDFERRLGWSYGAPGASVGIRWDPAAILRLGASVSWGGSLTATATDPAVSDRTIDLPVQVAAGASAYLAPPLLLAVSGRWSGWSVAADDLAAGSLAPGVVPARDTWEVGGGIEYESAARQSRPVPIRLGFSYAQLPFAFGGAAPDEWSVNAGIGMRFGESRVNPLAAVDLDLERGSRGDAATTGLTEAFWRINLSLTLFGR